MRPLQVCGGAQRLFPRHQPRCAHRGAQGGDDRGDIFVGERREGEPVRGEPGVAIVPVVAQPLQAHRLETAGLPVTAQAPVVLDQLLARGDQRERGRLEAGVTGAAACLQVQSIEDRGRAVCDGAMGFGARGGPALPPVAHGAAQLARLVRDRWMRGEERLSRQGRRAAHSQVAGDAAIHHVEVGLPDLP
jgi:hypothetical protein